VDEGQGSDRDRSLSDSTGGRPTVGRDPNPPSPFLVACLATWPPGPARGRALDLACGSGRHALLVAAAGFRVDAIDRDVAALQTLESKARADRLDVRAIAADLETHPLPRERYDLVVNARYLQRSLVGAIEAALAPGGALVFETFTTAQAELGRPRNPEYLLRPGELARMFPRLETLVYREEVRDGRECVASLFARRRFAERAARV
jgi:SAM-dependent methyltransferase